MRSPPVNEPHAYIIEFHRAFGPTVTIGPFATLDACHVWLADRGLRGMIVGLASPDVDTTAGADLWC